MSHVDKKIKKGKEQKNQNCELRKWSESLKKKKITNILE